MLHHRASKTCLHVILADLQKVAFGLWLDVYHGSWRLTEEHFLHKVMSWFNLSQQLNTTQPLTHSLSPASLVGWGGELEKKDEPRGLITIKELK